MDLWARLVEERIQRAIEAGEFDNLPTTGRPLNLRENPFAEERRLAHRILKNAGMAPRWIMIDAEIRESVARLHYALLHARRRSPDGGGPWRAAVENFRREAEAVNTRIHERNHLAPQSVRQRLPIRVEREIGCVIEQVRRETADSA